MQTSQIISVGSFGESQNIDGFAVGQIEKARRVFGNFGHDEIAQMGEEIARDVRQVVTLLSQVVDGAQTRVRIAIDECSSERMQDRAISDAKHAGNTFRGEFVAVDADPCEHLIEKTHSIAHAAGSFARDDGQRSVFERHFFLFEDKLESCGDGLRVD